MTARKEIYKYKNKYAYLQIQLCSNIEIYKYKAGSSWIGVGPNVAGKTWPLGSNDFNVNSKIWSDDRASLLGMIMWSVLSTSSLQKFLLPHWALCILKPAPPCHLSIWTNWCTALVAEQQPCQTKASTSQPPRCHGMGESLHHEEDHLGDPNWAAFIKVAKVVKVVKVHILRQLYHLPHFPETIFDLKFW